ncbi:BPSL0761 family protein [Caballeronia sp. J97]|uniref:BPSL0761 family protein n=1 Tax=Caballeronia sp. J97 TaxID=2805429 RepID=UPI002AB186EA|nr:BPSL0761 family protein [Caballeronia sp. J97]
MSTSDTCSVSVELEIRLIEWRVMAVMPGGGFHFVGFNEATSVGRVSSPILSFDSRDGRGLTTSGRCYRLNGESGSSRLAESVWSVYCFRNRIEDHFDATHLFALEDRMTTPSDRTRAVLDTRWFLQMLAEDEQISIAGLVRSVAVGLLRHYPTDAEMAVSATVAPTIWSAPVEKSPR